jgi:hypothetical protein
MTTHLSASTQETLSDPFRANGADFVQAVRPAAEVLRERYETAEHCLRECGEHLVQEARIPMSDVPAPGSGTPAHWHTARNTIAHLLTKK